MGYGMGVFLLALGLILALAVQDAISGVDITLIGWILAAVGVLVLVLTAVQANSRRTNRSVARTVHTDGTESVTERRTEQDPPPAV